MKNFILIVALSILVNATNINLDTLSAKAKKNNKGVLIFLHQPDCGFCDRMISQSIQNSNVLSQIKKDFIFVNIDIADKGEVKYKNFKGNKHDFAKKIDLDFYPSIIFINGNGEIVYKEIGYRTKQKFLNTLQYVATQSYKKITLATFTTKLDFNSDKD